MPTVIELGQRVKQKYPGQYDDLSDLEVGQRVKTKYPGAYDDFSDVASGPFKFNVSESDAQRANKISKLQGEAAESKKKADKMAVPEFKAKNIGKFAKFTLGAVRDFVFSSEVGLGETIRKSTANQAATYTESIQETTDTQVSLLKQIRKNEAEGKDATKLKQLYNDSVDQLQELNKGLEEETTLPTTGQAVGQLGGTAMDIVSAGTYGKLGTFGMQSGKLATTAPSAVMGVRRLAQEPAGLFTKRGVSRVITGGGMGYGFDVAHGLQGNRGEDRTGANAFIPGLGTAIGAGLPAVTGGIQSIKNRASGEYARTRFQNAVLKEKKALETLENSYKKVREITQSAQKKGIDPLDDIARSGVLADSVDKSGTIRTSSPGGALSKLDDYISPRESIVSRAVEREAKSLSVDDVRAALVEQMNKSNISGGAKKRALAAIDNEIEGLLLDATPDGRIPLTTVQQTKIFKGKTVNFLDPEKNAIDKPIISGLKSLVEKNTDSLDVPAVNKELARLYTMQEVLQALDGKKVRGGRLGKYFAKTIGGIVGSGAGPFGAVIGAETGGAIQGAIMSSTFKNKVGSLPETKLIDEALEAMGQSKKSPPLIQSQTTSTSNTITKGIIKENIPTNSSGVKGFINKLVQKFKDTPNKQGGFISIGNTSKAGVFDPKRSLADQIDEGIKFFSYDGGETGAAYSAFKKRFPGAGNTFGPGIYVALDDTSSKGVFGDVLTQGVLPKMKVLEPGHPEYTMITTYSNALEKAKEAGFDAIMFAADSGKGMWLAIDKSLAKSGPLKSLLKIKSEINSLPKATQQLLSQKASRGQAATTLSLANGMKKPIKKQESLAVENLMEQVNFLENQKQKLLNGGMEPQNQAIKNINKAQQKIVNDINELGAKKTSKLEYLRKNGRYNGSRRVA